MNKLISTVKPTKVGIGILMGIFSALFGALAQGQDRHISSSSSSVTINGNNITIQSNGSGLFQGGGEIIQGSGKREAQTRDVAHFSKISLLGSVNVVVEITDVPYVRVEADDNLIDLIETKVSGSRMMIAMKPGTTFSTRQPIDVYVGAAALEDLVITGSGDMLVKALSQAELSASVVGSGDLVLEGKVENVTMQVMGSGDIEASALNTQSATISVAGSGDVFAHVTQNLKALVQGSGDIRVTGNPAQRDTQLQGSGRIRVN